MANAKQPNRAQLVQLRRDLVATMALHEAARTMPDVLAAARAALVGLDAIEAYRRLTD